MPGIWDSVFQSAAVVADEVEKEANLDPTIFCRKRKIKDIENDEIGAFRQPVKLAKFIESTLSSISSNCRSSEEKPNEQDKQLVSVPVDATFSDKARMDFSAPIDSESKIAIDHAASYQQLSLEERCAKQICRKWLKFTYLKSNQPCDESCGRLHEVPKNPQKLYKDYSFRGLPPKQQKKILSNIKISTTENT
jgi:hypothetical protein